MSNNNQNSMVTPYYVIPYIPNNNPYVPSNIPVYCPSETVEPSIKNEKKRSKKYSEEIYNEAVRLKDSVVKRIEKELVDFGIQVEDDPELIEDLIDMVRLNYSGKELFVIGSGYFLKAKDGTWDFRQPTTRAVMNLLNTGCDPWFIVKASYYIKYERGDEIKTHRIDHTYIERPNDEESSTEEAKDDA